MNPTDNISAAGRGRELFTKMKRPLSAMEKVYGCFSRTTRYHMLERLGGRRGMLALGQRYALLRTLADEVGENVRVEESCWLKNVQNLSMGNNVSIWPMTYIEASGGVNIGNNVSIAHGVTIMSEEHEYGDMKTPIKDQGMQYDSVTIEDNVWIGAKVTILSGVTIHSGAVIGAGAVVTKDVPENAIVVGVPARVIKIRAPKERPAPREGAMKDIVLLTATYNHPNELAELYASLLAQEDKDFSWVIVDDGSGEETGEQTARFQQEGKLDLLVVRQENGGKSKAVNNGLDHLTEDVRAVVIVDDDEKLRPDAIGTVRSYMNRYGGTDCGVIHFNRMDEKDEVIATPDIPEDFFMPFQRFKSRGRWADGYICYFTDKLGKERFHIYEGEKYIAPSTLYMRVTERSRLLWASAVLGNTEYLEGGITKQGRGLRLKNPQGMIEYCRLMQRNGSSFKTRAAYSVHAFAYMEFMEDKTKANSEEFMPLAKLPGKLLAAYWRKRYAQKQG